MGDCRRVGGFRAPVLPFLPPAEVLPSPVTPESFPACGGETKSFVSGPHSNPIWIVFKWDWGAFHDSDDDRRASAQHRYGHLFFRPALPFLRAGDVPIRNWIADGGPLGLLHRRHLPERDAPEPSLRSLRGALVDSFGRGRIPDKRSLSHPSAPLSAGAFARSLPRDVLAGILGLSCRPRRERRRHGASVQQLYLDHHDVGRRARAGGLPVSPAGALSAPACGGHAAAVGRLSASHFSESGRQGRRIGRRRRKRRGPRFPMGGPLPVRTTDFAFFRFGWNLRGRAGRRGLPRDRRLFCTPGRVRRQFLGRAAGHPALCANGGRHRVKAIRVPSSWPSFGPL